MRNSKLMTSTQPLRRTIRQPRYRVNAQNTVSQVARIA